MKIFDKIEELGKLETELLKVLNPKKKGYIDIMNTYIQGKLEIIHMYEDKLPSRIYDELIDYCKGYLTLLKGEY